MSVRKTTNSKTYLIFIQGNCRLIFKYSYLFKQWWILSYTGFSLHVLKDFYKK